MSDFSKLNDLFHPPVRPLDAAEGAIAPHWRWSERHLQCVWADAALRPAQFTTASGAKITVADPGKWNLGAGPDFTNAVILRDGKKVRGDIEVHIRPGDWKAHRHDNDPLYANVVLHVTWFPESGGGVGTGCAPSHLPQHIEGVALRDALAAKRGFSLDAVDLAAYPYAVLPDPPRPCGDALADASKADKKAVLIKAGISRIRRKVARMTERVIETGSPARVFYEEIFAALGYKNNSSQMRRLAELLPEAQLSAFATYTDRYAALLGFAGLLPKAEKAENATAAAAARLLWDTAWKNGCAAPAERIPWLISQTRPMNHPRVRLAVAAAMFDGKPGDLYRSVSRVPRADPKKWVDGVVNALFDPLYRAVDAAGGVIVSLGEERANTIITNIITPLFIATGTIGENMCEALPAEALNEQTRMMSYRMFGRDHNTALYKTSGLLTQGLLEIWNMFCLSDKSLCADCPFAAALK